MEQSKQKSYHPELGLESALIEMARVGMKGNSSATRKFATQLIRSVPHGVSNSKEFRLELHSALSSIGKYEQIDFSSESLPMESGGAGSLVDVDDFPRIDLLVLPDQTQSELDEIVLERRSETLLTTRGLSPTRSVLLSGPPGVGKTITSEWIAQELGLPLVSLNIAAVLSSYLGTSGRNIRSVLEFAKSKPCVLLLDEFDALAKARDDSGDIGELKRVVNVLLVELDRWNDRSLLIAATNHAQLLDPAIERRFDRTIIFPLPGKQERRTLLRELVGDELTSDAREITAEVTEGFSPSELTRLMRNMSRRSALKNEPLDKTLLQEILTLNDKKYPSRPQIWRILHFEFDISFRKIAELSGVSHPTVANSLRTLKNESRTNEYQPTSPSITS